MKVDLKNLRPGDLITRKSRIDGKVDSSFQGVPLQIKAVSLPFIYGDLWNFTHKKWESNTYYTIDVRSWEIMRISKNAIL